jgi:hypothetical protein
MQPNPDEAHCPAQGALNVSLIDCLVVHFLPPRWRGLPPVSLFVMRC